MIGSNNVICIVSNSQFKAGQKDSDVFLLTYTKYTDDHSWNISVMKVSSQLLFLPDFISDFVNFIKVNPFQGQLSSCQTSVVSDKTDGILMQIVVTDDGTK